jgi:hypothetical protein
MSLAYDSQRGVIVLFGGDAGTFPRLGDTWEWDGATWTQRATTGPEKRSDAGMTFDSVRGVCVLFGGIAVPQPNEFTYFGDTWTWDGSVWTRVSNTGPSPRRRVAMTFDALQGRAIIFGGERAGGSALDETCLWDGAVWSQMAGAQPRGRSRAAMVFAPDRAENILYGGIQSPAELWTLSTPQPSLGDLNCDCASNAFDIEPFLIAMIDPVAYGLMYPGCDIELADVNQDGSLDAFDIEPFIEILLAP